ncbi:uncharacterized protein C8R40DRAFT_1073412 [Lentinula edodes]|uniref:uncharacterized protein n=1 Tax=Lentinula edodes TaxID=5353 RepID=UPI001E8D2E47|nr:uncharacterized protein C8R40DRAFT_1073412 [Lentinula edodes]KAH7870352.1 hypothetical protein C8R40DRAFT_1073412 [Lentinula edodes]
MMCLHLASVLLAIVAMTHLSFGIPITSSGVDEPSQILSRAGSDVQTVLISFNKPGPEGTKEEEAVTNTIQMLFDDAHSDTKGVIPPVKLTFKNHLATGRKTIALIPITFTGLDIYAEENVRRRRMSSRRSPGLRIQLGSEFTSRQYGKGGTA